MSGDFWAHDHWNLDSPPDFVTFAKKMLSRKPRTWKMKCGSCGRALKFHRATGAIVIEGSKEYSPHFVCYDMRPKIDEILDENGLEKASLDA